MARKKGLLQNKPVILAAGGGGLVFAALVAIFVLGFGFDTFPQIDAESIIQKALTVDEIAQNEGVIFDINNAFSYSMFSWILYCQRCVFYAHVYRFIYVINI